MKIYCKNCKFGGSVFENLVDYGGHLGWKWCEFRKLKEKNEYTGITELCSTAKAEKNNNGECNNYKRKFLKFWIK